VAEDDPGADGFNYQGTPVCAEVFLEELGMLGSAEGMASLCRKSVESFYLAWAEGKGNSCRRLMGQALRSLLRFCHERGLVKYPLDKAVPPFHAYSLAKPPQGLDEGQMKKVFAGVPTDSDVGRRDRAILRLLETYGVRAGQVQRLRLDDIHWRLDEILFRALKGGKDSRLPLTEEAGMALLDYLRLSRPKTSCPEVFLTMTPPFRPLHTSTGISCIVKRRMKAAGIDSPGLAAHGYRHGLATRCLNEGHSLKEIADLLGHRQLNSTFHYTKVDFLTLRPVALEWPEKGHS